MVRWNINVRSSHIERHASVIQDSQKQAEMGLEMPPSWRAVQAPIRLTLANREQGR